MSDLHHILVEFANAVQSASHSQRAEYLRVFHDRIAALSAPAPQGIGADLRETRAYRDGLRAGFRMGESGEADRYEAALSKMQSEITEAALLPTEPPAQGEG